MNFCKTYNIKIPNSFRNIKIYEEIENFRDAEYIYCIAYEMLIRTDEYKALLYEYEPLKNKSKNDMTNDEFLKLRELIDRMNALGLKKTSFLGFDCDDDNDNVFKRIAYYNEIINSPWNVRMLHKFKSDSTENIFYQLAKFYFEKGKLYKLTNSNYYPIPTEAKELIIDYIENKSKWKTEEECKEFYNLLEDYYICTGETTDPTKYKSLSSNTICLSELDKDFLSLLKEKKNDNLLIQTKSDVMHGSIEFWYKYSVNDIKNGLKKLIAFHIDNNMIYDENSKHINTTIDKILENPSNFYIPCVNRLVKAGLYPWKKTNNSIINNEFISQLKFNGIKSILGNKGYIKLNREDNIYLMEISKYISLNLLDDSFLRTLTYEDLENSYINTEPVFSRPRLMFDEARLTNIPINLNLSKEDLLHYISQIKNEYDKNNKNIIKTDNEYFFNLPLESDLTQLPTYIKYANEKRTPKDKKLLPVKRNEFKKDLASAFYIYDLYKFFIRLFKIKKKCIRRKRNFDINKTKRDAKNEGDIIPQDTITKYKDDAKTEIVNYENNNLLTQISYLFDDLSNKQVEYCLTTMKEFIHGVDLIKETNSLKKVNNPKKHEKIDPKYKDLIIGNSYIAKSNNKELINSLGI